MAGFLNRLGRDRRGNVAVIVASSLTMLVGFGALGVDAGSFFLAKRRLQGVADAAALAAAGSATAQAAAQRAIASSGQPARIVRMTPGRYDMTAAGAGARFVPGTAAGAMRVTLAQETPLFFAGALTGEANHTVVASAAAAKVDLAAFSLGSRLAAVNGGVPGALLSALGGSSVTLSVMDYNALAGANVDLLSFADALRTQLRLTGVSYDQVLATHTTLPVVVAAMASAVGGTAGTLLSGIATRLPATQIVPALLMNLGPMGREVSVQGGQRLSIDAFGLLREALTIAGGARQVSMNLGAGIPGLAATQVTLVVGNRLVSSPYIAVGRDGNATVTTTQTRLLVSTQIASALPLGISLLNVPIVVELAQARATLAQVQCAPPRRAVSVQLNVTPSPGTISIASVNTATFGNLSTPVAYSPATIASVPLILALRAQTSIQLNSSTPIPVTFSAGEIAAHTVKTVNSSALAGGLAASLLRNTQLTASVLGILTLPLSVVTTAVGGALQLAAPLLDGLLNQLTALLGIGIGQADTRIDGVRCGAPMLIG
jgi:uncharacterized membrane protein